MPLPHFRTYGRPEQQQGWVEEPERSPSQLSDVGHCLSCLNSGPQKEAEGGRRAPGAGPPSDPVHRAEQSGCGVCALQGWGSGLVRPGCGRPSLNAQPTCSLLRRDNPPAGTSWR